jgi:HSP20 family protein
MFGYLTTNGSNPFDYLRELQQQMDQVFGASSGPASIRAVARGSFPPINVGVTSEAVDVFVFAAGLDPKKLDISIQQNVLTIAGTRSLPVETESNYYVRERYDGEFRRAVSLPEDVDVDKLDATYRDGVLHIKVQRREAVKPRQIRIN